MKKDNLVSIRHILDSIDHIENFLKEIDETKFSQSRHWQDAFIRELEVSVKLHDTSIQNS